MGAFLQIRSFRGKDKKGTGLGLSIVKEIIQAHDEHINVISTEGLAPNLFFFKQSKDNVNKTKKTSGFILHSEIQKYRSNKILMFSLPDKLFSFMKLFDLFSTYS